jgi:protocatechuate 3,4-dioxygenase alpha subunit
MGTGSDNFIGFNFLTYKPGKINDSSAPHINLTVFARGMLNHLFTRIYFSDEKNEIDEVFNQVDPLLRPRLIAEKVNEEEYYFDIILQGENETIFFDI